MQKEIRNLSKLWWIVAPPSVPPSLLIGTCRATQVGLHRANERDLTASTTPLASWVCSRVCFGVKVRRVLRRVLSPLGTRLLRVRAQSLPHLRWPVLRHACAVPVRGPPSRCWLWHKGVFFQWTALHCDPITSLSAPPLWKPLLPFLSFCFVFFFFCFWIRCGHMRLRKVSHLPHLANPTVAEHWFSDVATCSSAGREAAPLSYLF